jgi:hypothetical protein
MAKHEASWITTSDRSGFGALDDAVDVTSP